MGDEIRRGDAAQQILSDRVARVTRFEVINHRADAKPFGRQVVEWGCAISLSFQDGGRTLKVFVNDPAAVAKPSCCFCGHAETEHADGKCSGIPAQNYDGEPLRRCTCTHFLPPRDE